MSVVANDLKVAGGGRLEPSLLMPDEGSVAFDARLTAYIAEGVAKGTAAGLSAGSDLDAATKQWAYHRAFDAQFIRMSSSLSTLDLKDQGSGSFLVTQIQNFKDLAAEALAAFEELTAPAIDEDDVSSGWSTLQSLRH